MFRVLFYHHGLVPRVLILLGLVVGLPFSQQILAKKSILQRKVLSTAEFVLQKLGVSYQYGGNSVRSMQDCYDCLECTNRQKKPLVSRECTTCKYCSLDCSHFVQFIYQKSGLNFPYITSKGMLETSSLKLQKNYHLIHMGRFISQAQEADLLVFSGHVVLLESLNSNGKATIIHATRGQDIKGAGLGIQRVRNIHLNRYFGKPVRRVLRHEQLIK